MAQQLYFSRDSKLYLEFDNKVWEIPVLDGFSFSQATNTSDITLSEMQGADGISRRGRRLFTDSLAPAEWSFSTYVRPYLSTEHGAVEEALWAVMAGADKYAAANAGGGLANVTNNGGSVNWATSGKAIAAGTYYVNDESSTGVTVSETAPVGWQVKIVVSTTAVTSVTVESAGSGWTSGDTITLDGETFFGGASDSTDLVLTCGTVTTENSSFYRATNIDENSTYGAGVVTPTTSKSTINFGQSNRSVLATCNLYFVMETSTTKPMVYKLENAAINEASIDFEVDGIATINWSGFAKNIVDMQSKGDVFVQPGTTISGKDVGDIILDSNSDFKMSIATASNAVVTAIDTGVDATTNFIRNRLTQLVCTTGNATAFPSGTYNLTLTGGNITVSNNITYLVPEELGNVNIPIEGVTGGRTATGNFTCYLTLDTEGADKGSSVDLFNDMTTSGQGLDLVVNDFDLTFQIGGSVASTPRLYVQFPKAHIEVPVHSVEDVISVETGFGAYTDDFGFANELKLEYYGV